jgi:hypothetical protein
MDRPWKVIAAFIGVFMAGAVFGGLFTLGASARRAPVPRPAQVLPAPDMPRPKVAGPAAPVPVNNLPGGARNSPLTPQLMRQFTRELALSSEQREKILPIVGRAGEDFQRLRDEENRRRQENVADVARVNERMYVDVAAVLTPEQRTKLQQMRERFEERLRADRQKRVDAEAAFKAAQKDAKDAQKSPATRPADGAK